jgi:TPR repeat protein
MRRRFRETLQFICLSTTVAFAYGFAHAEPQWPPKGGPKSIEEVEAFVAIMSDDYEKAAPLLKPLAEKGHPLYQGILGDMYLRGLGVKQDFTQAKQWLEKASEQGNPDASFSLAMMYELGNGVAKDQRRGARILEKAAEQGSKSAPLPLALKYHEGIGVLKDNVLAYAWSNIGAALGDSDSEKFRSAIEKMMSAAEIQEGQRVSREWFARHYNNAEERKPN